MEHETYFVTFQLPEAKYTVKYYEKLSPLGISKEKEQE